MGAVLPSRRGLSPVIATLTLVSIVVVVSIAVAIWASGIMSGYFKSEKVELVSISCTYFNDTWSIKVLLKNSGSSNVRISQCFINEMEVDLYGTRVPGQGKSSTDMPSSGLLLSSGESAEITVYIDGPDSGGFYSLTPGTSIYVKLVSSSGSAYYKPVELVG